MRGTTRYGRIGKRIPEIPVRLDKNTKILQHAAPLDYEEKTGLPVRSTPLSIKDIRKGQRVIVRAGVDLRSVTLRNSKPLK
jgi:hypothetical protein